MALEIETTNGSTIMVTTPDGVTLTYGLGLIPKRGVGIEIQLSTHDVRRLVSVLIDVIAKEG